MSREPHTVSSWRQHPLAKRLPLFVLAALGLWLWQRSQSSQRELVLQLHGPGWATVHGIDVQLATPEGVLVEREERYFSGPPPAEITLECRLDPGRYQLSVFVQGVEGPPLRATVDVRDERYIVQKLELARPH